MHTIFFHGGVVVAADVVFLFVSLYKVALCLLQLLGDSTGGDNLEHSCCDSCWCYYHRGSNCDNLTHTRYNRSSKHLYQ